MMYKKLKKVVSGCIAGTMIFTSVFNYGTILQSAYAAETSIVMDDTIRTEIEASLYDFEYYCMANEDVAVALGYDKEKMYEHWLNFGMAEGRNASMVFNAKYYLEVNPSVKEVVGNDYVAAYEHFVTTGLLQGLESSPVFSVKYYLQANQDVAGVFGNDYIKAANHFNQNALAEGRSGSGNFDYTVYKNCNTDVAQLYGDEIKGYYIHYINHGRAEGRTAGLGTSGDGGNTGGNITIDETAVSYRIFDAEFYLEKYPELAQNVGTEKNALYTYWMEEGIALGQSASPIFDPQEYLTINTDVAEVLGEDYEAATNHFLNYGIYEGRSGNREFDYTVYKYCNKDVVEVFGEDIVGYYFHYVHYGRTENRTATLVNITPTIIPKPTSMPIPTATPSPIQEIIVESFNNTLKNLSVYGTTCNSYITKTDIGYQEVLIDDKIYILDFDKSGNLISKKVIDFELSLFGGYYSGEDYNYLVFGKSGSSNGAEIYRIVKYDKEFNRIKALSILYKDCYTRIPFEAGNVSIAEFGNHMTVYTSRLRSDGHQSNIALKINSDTMTIEDSYGMGEFPDIHVSHSFRQIIKYDGDTPIYVDLGDAYPRAVCLQQQEGILTNMLDISGQQGNNITETDVSGMEITKTGYLVVGTQKKNCVNNIYLSYVGKGETTAQVTWLTNGTTYNYSNVCNTKIVKVTDGIYAVMWNCFDNGGSVNYVMVNDEGKLISSMKSLQGAELTQCEPILDDGCITWIKYINGKRTLYSLTDFECIGSYELEDTYVFSENSWDGNVDVSWYKEWQKEFTLTTTQQLAGLARLVNNGNTFEDKKIFIGADMFFNEENSIENVWESIASSSSGICFEGTFDGQGHTFYNLYTISGEEGGLFGIIGKNGIVKAIRISQSSMCGAAIAYKNNGWILFCENNSLVENIGDTNYTAGICCENTNLVYGCSNTGVILGMDASGIVGNNSGSVATIDSCWNQGFVKGKGFAVAGIVSSNQGWVYDCYNAGSISGTFIVNYAKTVAGIVGGHHPLTAVSKNKQVYNCYNMGYMDIDDDWNWYCSDTICGEGKGSCTNVYSIPSQYTSFEEVTVEELKTEAMLYNIQGEKIIQKWCLDTENLNNSCIIPIAQQDIENGIYKILPDVWNPITEISVNLVNREYQLKAFSSAYYGIQNAIPVYSSSSDILSITEEGIITPLKTGQATVTVTFEETEHTKETSYEVIVIIEK